MFKSRYAYEREGSNLGVKSETSKLVAVFSFDDETAPKDREDIKDRLNLNYYAARGDTLATYFKHDLGMTKESNAPRGTYIKHSSGVGFINLRVRRHCTRLGFTLKMEQRAKITPEEMIDLDRLDHFIKTGETELPEEREKSKSA